MQVNKSLMNRNNFAKSAAMLLLASAGMGAFFNAHAENTNRASAEPACQGDAVLFCENWEDGDWNGWRDVAEHPDRGGFTCATGDCLLPYPGYNNSRAVAIRLKKDAADGIFPRAPFNKSVGPNDTVYVRWRAYWSPGFHFNYQNTKHFYLLTNAADGYQGGNYRVGFFVQPPEGGGDPTVGVPYIHLYKRDIDTAPGSWQDKEYGEIRYRPNQPGTENFRITGGKWYEIEMRITPNPQGQSTGGRVQFWIDGKLMADHSDNVSVRKANEKDVFDGVWLSSYFGGGGQTNHPDQYVIYDDIIASKQRIGAASSAPAKPSSPTQLRADG